MKPFELLEWDSDFLGFEVYRINRQAGSETELAALLTAIPASARLVYYPGAAKVALESPALQSFHGFEADIKTIYVKHNIRTGILPEHISSCRAGVPDEQLKQLAIQSGIWSRFNRDPRIGGSKFEALYTIWMNNSLNRTIAKEVLIYQVEEKIAGVVTLGEKNGRGDIGLLAVDERYRGMGIGTALMAAAEHWSASQGYTSMQVVTQGLNRPACALYEKSGCVVENTIYFYHFWPERS